MSRIDYRFAESDVGRLPALAAQLVERKVTVVYTATTVSGARHESCDFDDSRRFATGADPVKSGLVASLNRPAISPA